MIAAAWPMASELDDALPWDRRRPAHADSIRGRKARSLWPAWLATMETALHNGAGTMRARRREWTAPWPYLRRRTAGGSAP